jgi:hypothetical protein
VYSSDMPPFSWLTAAKREINKISTYLIKNWVVFELTCILSHG